MPVANLINFMLIQRRLQIFTDCIRVELWHLPSLPPSLRTPFIPFALSPASGPCRFLLVRVFHSESVDRKWQVSKIVPLTFPRERNRERGEDIGGKGDLQGRHMQTCLIIHGCERRRQMWYEMSLLLLLLLLPLCLRHKQSVQVRVADMLCDCGPGSTLRNRFNSIWGNKNWTLTLLFMHTPTDTHSHTHEPTLPPTTLPFNAPRLPFGAGCPGG